MKQIIFGISLGVIAFVAIILHCKSTPVALIHKEASFTSDIISDSATTTKVHTVDYKSDPIILWASDNVKYWIYDDARINPQKWDANWAINFNKIRQFTSFEKPFQLELFAYPTIENKAIRTQNMRTAHVSKSQIHLVSNIHFQGENWGEQYRPLIQVALGNTKHEPLEIGLAMQWCDKIRGQDIAHWVSLLAQAKALPDLTTFYDKDAFEVAPPFSAKLAAASWVTYCIETKGKKWFLDHYQSPPPSKEVLNQWNIEWKEWILANSPLSISNINPYKGAPLNGFTLAHQGYRIYNGYGSDLAKKSLEKLATLGTNAIAIVPYSYMRSAYKADRIPTMNRPEVENDEAVLFSHFTAKSLGQFTLLKPQIWIHNGWPGDVEFDNNKEWNQFFLYYRTWIMHYALLAEMNDMDAFCIGTELLQVTLKHPEYWRALIKDIRKIYHGSLTYAANWGEECEKITFWEDLDFIGINCYYPLHKGNEATEAELRQGAKRNIAKIKRIHEQYQRPVWLTEVGFRSATSPWKSPHSEAGIRLIDDEAQALCFDVLLSELQQNDWIKGSFWWKWPSYLDCIEDQGRGYMPLGKPAEEVMKKYFIGE